MNLILLGPPGAGKGTQASMICNEFKLTHISTGDLLRNETKNSSDLGKEIKSIVDAGNLVSNEIIIKILKNFISKNNDASGFLFDGFPRNAEQAGLLDQLMHEMNFKLNAVIMLDVDKELLLNRIDPSPIRKRSLSFKLKFALSLDFLKVKSIISWTLYKITFFNKFIEMSLESISFTEIFSSLVLL